MPYQIKAMANTPYRPSNGTEGMMFQYHWCERCVRDQKFQETQDGEDGCPIVLASMCYYTEDPEYPKEWIHDENGEPMCTAFQSIEKEEMLDKYVRKS